jgi:hypothetical protein
MRMQPIEANEITARIARSTGPELLAYVIWMCADSAHMVTSLAAVIVVAAIVIVLGMILNYLQRKCQIESAAELAMAQQVTFRAMLEMSASKPDAAAGFRLLILADALHMAVERNGAQPVDQTHRHLYACNSSESAQSVGNAGLSNSPGSCPAVPPV